MAYRSAASGKECSRCGATFPLSLFARDSRSPDGKAAKCRACDSIRHRKT